METTCYVTYHKLCITYVIHNLLFAACNLCISCGRFVLLMHKLWNLGLHKLWEIYISYA